MADFDEAIDRVIAGLKKTRVMSAKEREIVATHEAGHAVAAEFLPGAGPATKISIVSRGIAALGYTQQLPTADRYLMVGRWGETRRFRTDVRRGEKAMATGTIKKLVRERGFGFIQGHDGIELFFHRSALQGEGFDTLAEGQAVEFDVERGDKGPRAANMKVSPPSA